MSLRFKAFNGQLICGLVCSNFWCAPLWAAEDFEGRSFYIGDIHAHSGASGDGASSDLGDCTGECGSLAGIGETARANRLDFLSLTDHVNGPMAGMPADYKMTVDQMLEVHRPSAGLVTLPGAELWFSQVDTEVDYGHKTLLMFGKNADLETLTIEDVRPLSGGDETVDNCIDIWSWMDDLVASWGPALLIAHHPALERPMSTTWSCHDGDIAPVVEVYSEHGSSMGLGDGFAPPWSSEDTSGTVLTALDEESLRIGFAAGSDNHDTHPGDPCAVDTIRTSQPYGQGFTIAVLDADEMFDRESLYRAFMERRTYATTGPLLPAVITWFAGSMTLGEMGEEVEASDAGGLSVEIRIPPDLAPYIATAWVHTPERSLLLTGPSDGVWTGALDAAEVPRWAFAEIQVDGWLWYGEDACDRGGVEDLERVWLSPTWFDPVADMDGDGWSMTEGDCDDYDVLVHPFGTEDCVLPGDEDCNGVADEADPACMADTGGPDTAAPETGSVPEDSGTPSADEDSGPEDSPPVQEDDTASSVTDTGGSLDDGAVPSADKGCSGCATSGGSTWMWWLPAWAMAVRRRP